ncbi:MAG: fatty acid desaturase [Isosphaeraceae bacterium]
MNGGTMISGSPRELLAQIPANVRERRLARGLSLFTLNLTSYLVLVSAACLAPGCLARSACVLVAGGVIGSLYVIGHDAGHGSFVPGRRLNRWLARIAFLPAYAPLASWYHAHVLLHHRFLRVRGRDMAWVPWSHEDYRRASLWRRTCYRFLRTPVGLSFYWTAGNWVPHLLFPPTSELGSRVNQFRADRLLVVAYALILYGYLLLLTWIATSWRWADPAGPLGVAFLGLVGPYLVWTYLIGMTDLLHHSHPRAICFNDRSEWDYYSATVVSTVHVTLPWWINWLTNNILEHTAHHVDPRVPLYNLPEAQTRLEGACAGDVQVESFSFGYLLRILRICRLYDYERRQWLDYDGTPTSPSQREAISVPPTSQASPADTPR